MTGRAAVQVWGACLLVAAAGAALTMTLSGAASAQGRVLGGFSPVATNGEAVQAAAQFAAQSMGGELASVDAAEQQAVQGTNIRMELTLHDGSRWRVTVYRNLQGDYSISGTPGQLQEAISPDGPDTGTNDGSDSDDNQSGTGETGA